MTRPSRLLVQFVRATLFLVIAGTLSRASNAAPVPASVSTTDSGCTLNLNIYSAKGDVYLTAIKSFVGSPGFPDGDYCVEVTDPTGATLLGSSTLGAVKVTGGVFATCYRLSDVLVKASDSSPGYDDTPNAGGEYKVWLSVLGSCTRGSSTDSFKVIPPPTIVATGGTPQSTAVSTAFSTDLQATATDGFGNLLAAVDVTFTAPASGASALFSNATNTITVPTDGSGLATASVSANATAGAYTVTAAMTGAIAAAEFSLTNTAAQAGLGGMKYYDANANGQWDSGEVGIESWPVSITLGATSTLISTASDGTFSATVDPETYTVAESVSSNPQWVHTGNLTDQSLTTGVALNGDKTYTVAAAAGGTYSGLLFGNLCVGPGGAAPGGASGLGYYTSKGGQAEVGADDLAELTALNLRSGSGADFDPASKPALKSWLASAKATNMAYMLSAHLATMTLNVLNGHVSASELIRATGTTSANAAGFASVGAVMAEANAELGLHGLTKSGSAFRAYQELLKNALESANQNKTFVQPSACPSAF
jgi:hypothetical protein